jgi:hypothetical protein
VGCMAGVAWAIDLSLANVCVSAVLVHRYDAYLNEVGPQYLL